MFWRRKESAFWWVFGVHSRTPLKKHCHHFLVILEFPWRSKRRPEHSDSNFESKKTFVSVFQVVSAYYSSLTYCTQAKMVELFGYAAGCLVWAIVLSNVITFTRPSSNSSLDLPKRVPHRKKIDKKRLPSSHGFRYIANQFYRLVSYDHRQYSSDSHGNQFRWCRQLRSL